MFAFTKIADHYGAYLLTDIANVNNLLARNETALA
jgi:glycine/serine hydroxymethyltransferase